MEPQRECEPTTSEPIPNTSRPQNEQQGSEQPINTKPIDSEQKTDHGVAKSSQYFTLLDLRRLTFTLDGEHVLNAQDATQDEFDALVDFAYNVGNGAFKGSRMLHVLNSGDYAGAAAQFQRWDHVGDDVSAGLLRRRQAEVGLFNNKDSATQSG